MTTAVATEFAQTATPVSPAPPISLRGIWFILAATLATLFIAGLTATAVGTGMLCLIFPELGALAQDVFTRPGGRWSTAPLHLVVTPTLTATVGILVSQRLSYGYGSVLLAVGLAVAILKLSRSPVAPAVSAALLPVVFQERSWWYPLAVFIGVTGLAILSAAWKRLPGLREDRSQRQNTVSKNSEQTSRNQYWIIVLSIFLVAVVYLVKLTGSRFLLFPPLAVIALEMFSRPGTCPWTKRPYSVPLACFLTATGGFVACKLLGVGAIAAAASMVWSFAVLYLLKIHLPPAMAVGLIPLIIKSPTVAFPVSVAAGTVLLIIASQLYGQWLKRFADQGSEFSRDLQSV